MSEHPWNLTQDEKDHMRGIDQQSLESFKKFLKSLPYAGVLYVLATEERDRNDYDHPMVMLARAEHNLRVKEGRNE